MKKIAIVGGAGFIGHNLAIYLKKYGYDPFIIDSLSVNNLYSLNDTEFENKELYKSILNKRLELLADSKIETIIEDARNYTILSRTLSKIQPDVIIQLAAVSHANKSNKDPHNTFDHSLRTLENSLDIARSFQNIKPCHFIYFSSSMVYGNFIKDEVDEDTQCDPIGIYDTLKLSGELIVKSYNRVFGIPYTIIRPSALYGERCVSRRVGQIFIENAVQAKNIQINGTGSESLDFTYINDLCQGVKLVIEKKESLNETFNITYGQSRTINELIEILNSKFKKINVIFKPKEKFNPIRGTLNVNKAKNLLGYNPEYPIEIGYSNYIDWYKKFWKNN
ncbi:NAD(P)-dependent oxidoreductase [Pelagibacteraceae bacterium]|nr:NAD(P)-dependent oxidoreductase [Pelagibacteraceae bacterium]